MSCLSAILSQKSRIFLVSYTCDWETGDDLLDRRFEDLDRRRGDLNRRRGDFELRLEDFVGDFRLFDFILGLLDRDLDVCGDGDRDRVVLDSSPSDRADKVEEILALEEPGEDREDGCFVLDELDGDGDAEDECFLVDFESQTVS
eukprot:sb/3473923/